MIYFDAAATTFQKPRAVRQAVLRALETMSSPGRGNYFSAALAADTVYSCREELAALFGAEDPERVVFTGNTTHALNIAIRSLVKPGSRVVISGYEHNAVTRTLNGLDNVSICVIDTPLFDHTAMLERFDEALREKTDAVICTHVSNVFGYVLPVAEIASLCRERKIPFIIDAAQSGGILPIDQRRLGAAFVALPGHKGLYGPQGTGVLLCGAEAQPLLFGGTGSNSRERTMPDFLPDRLEAGTHNVPGIAGLLEGVRFVRRVGSAAISLHERYLKQVFMSGIGTDERYEIFACGDDVMQSGVVSFRLRGMDCEELCALLARKGFALRGGYHCAPLAHKTAGTLETGTVRFSPSAFNREWEVFQLLEELKKL